MCQLLASPVCDVRHVLRRVSVRPHEEDIVVYIVLRCLAAFWYLAQQIDAEVDATFQSLVLADELLQIGSSAQFLERDRNTDQTVVSNRSKIDEQFIIEFWPPEDVARLESEAEEAGMDVPLDGPEPILEKRIDIGQMAYEHFAAALDPYPRKTDASFDWKDPQSDPDSEDGNKPFAELARLKDPNSVTSD